MAFTADGVNSVNMHIAAESWVGSRSWQGGDRDKSLIYWVHFLPTPPLPPLSSHLTAQGQKEKEKQKVWSEAVREERGKQREEGGEE